MPREPYLDRAWTAALVLIIIVLALNLFARAHRALLRAQDPIRTPPVAKAIDARDLNIYYGSFLAVEGVNMTIKPKTVTALIGPSGCGKSTYLRSINRMHEVIPGARVEGVLELDGKNLYGPGVDPVGRAPRRSAWSSSGPTRSPRCRSTTT